MIAERTPIRSPAAGLSLAIGAFAVCGLAGLLCGGEIGIQLPSALAVYALIAALVGRSIALDRPFGWANTVTLGRAVLTSALAGQAAALLLGTAEPDLGLWAAAIAVAALATDGIDGWIARSTGSSTDFGARFDMEIDALLIMILALMVWGLGIAGAWILAAGLLRYAFVAAGAVWASLAAPLPPSLRRKAICVVQSVSLVVMLVAGPELGPAIGSMALVALVASFAVDVAWLIGRQAAAPAT